MVSSEKMKVLVTQLPLTLCNPMDNRPPGSSVCGILQVKILEWVAIPIRFIPILLEVNMINNSIIEMVLHNRHQ